MVMEGDLMQNLNKTNIRTKGGMYHDGKQEQQEEKENEERKEKINS